MPTATVPQPDVSTAKRGREREPYDTSGRERARRPVTRGITAAALTAAGLAGAVVLGSQTRLSRKLPVLRRTTRTQAVRRAIAKRLP
jgi:hypothetical protein